MKNKEQFLKNTVVVCIGAMICCALWGSAFPCVKIGYELFNVSQKDVSQQILFAGIRFTLAGLLTIIIGSIASKKILIPKKESLSNVIKLSLLQTVAQYTFFYIGLANTTGVKASIIEGINVFVAIVVASMIFHLEKLTSRKIIGSVIGFLGVILVNVNGSGLDTSVKLTGEGFIAISTVAYAFSSVFFKRYSTKENPVVLSGYQFIAGGLIMTFYGIITGGKITTITPQGLSMLLYLGMLSAAAYTLWGILLKYNPVSKVAVFGFMNPVFGVLLSTVILKEYDNINVKCFIALIMVCIGIYIVNRTDNKNNINQI